MEPKSVAKQKRRKKRDIRTEVSSDSSESEANASSSPETVKKTSSKSKPSISDAAKSKSQIESEFTKFYLQRATVEFAEDLDKIRNADDFKDEALPILIQALQQGTGLFSVEDQRRVVLAGGEGGREGGK